MPPHDARSPSTDHSLSVNAYTPPDHRPSTTLFAAVHGIGDQTAYETIQSVALRVSAHLGQAFAPPLGRFYFNPKEAPSTAPAPAVPQLMTAEDGPLEGIGLGEVYWAPIPRQVAGEKYVLEETKRWASSIAARIAFRSETEKRRAAQKAQRLVVVVDEMVETIQTLQRVTFVADKAGLFKFDLGQLLTDFVGDVQLVADFQVYRQRIIDEFDSTMAQTLALAEGRDAKIFIVAHSEGTVVTFVALLEALANPAKYTWIRQIGGLMTIGSPIETHHLMWPDLWRTPALGPAKDAEGIHIPWQNYMDFGDPIAYELTETEKWLRKTGFDPHLFPVTHAFSRYPLPGKAHTDYWNDDDVFGHFLTEVVRMPPGIPRKYAEMRKKVTTWVNRVTQAKGDVRSKWWVPIFTFAFPYALVAALLFAGAYLLEHAVIGSLPAAAQPDFGMGRVFRDVVGIGSLMFGVTAASRLPRLSDKPLWWLAGTGLLIVSMLIFRFAADPATQEQMPGSTIGVWLVAAFVALISGLFTRASARHGHYMLPALGLVAAAGIVINLTRTPVGVSLWPVVLALVLFFYIWWLSALLFDLSFVWRRYARHAVVQERLADMAQHAVAKRATAAVG